MTRTDADGFYSFDTVPAGDYVIDVNNSYINYYLQLFLTTPPEPTPHNLGECEVGFHDFGYGPKGGVIGDFVWYDVNQNNQQDEWYDANDNGQYDEWFDINGNGFIDEGELDKCGLRLIPVALQDAAGSPPQDKLTDHWGFYNFIDLPGGTYQITVDKAEVFVRAADMAIEGKCKPLPSGAPLTTAAQAIAQPLGELLDITEITGGEIVLARSGPEQIPADIGGQVREDRDADGDLSDPDSGIAGVTIELYVDNNGDGYLDAGDSFVTDTSTVSDGTYLFLNMAPAQYIVVEVDPPGVGSTNDTAPPNNNQIPVDVGSGPTHTGNDFLDTSVTCYLTPDGGFVIELPPGGVYLDADFAASCLFGLGAIGDFVWYDANRDAIQDVGEPGLDNVTLDLYEDTDGNGSGDTLVDSTVTDADGGYLFRDLPPGDYIVDVTDLNGKLVDLVHTTGSQSQPDPSNLISLVAGEVYKDADFGYVEPDTGQVIIGDTVWYDTDGDGFQQPWEIGIPGVTVEATDVAGASYTAVTDDLGRYHIEAPVGSYTVQPAPAPAGLTATTPETHDTGLLLPGVHYLDADFGYRTDVAGTIGNLVFEDVNENGMFDVGDGPLAGVSVDLIRDSNFNGLWDTGEPIIATTTTTNALDGFNGNYQFTGLPSGNYLVHVSDTNAVLIDYVKSVLGTPGQDNNNQADPYAASINLPLGAVNLMADFGYVKIDRPNTSVIGNQVWLERPLRNGAVQSW